MQRFSRYNKETSSLVLSKHEHENIRNGQAAYEKEKEKHLVGPLVQVQVSIEDSIHKAKRVYCNYEENFKQYGEAILDESSENSDGS